MIKTEVIKTVILEESVIDRLKEFTESDNIEGFIKTFIDWMIENNIRINILSVVSPEYVDENGKDKLIRLEDRPICSYYNYCKDLTGLDEEDFCYWIRETCKSKKLFKYKAFTIKPLYSIGTSRSLDTYYNSPRFIIYYPEEVKEII